MHNDLSVLQELTLEDIKLISEKANLDNLLGPIKVNSKYYSKYYPQYIKGLGGKLSKDSHLVKKNLPSYACNLFKKNDIRYRNYFAMEAEDLKKHFVELLHECIDPNLEPEKMSTFILDDYKKLFSEILKRKTTSFDLQLFYLQIRMFKINISDEMRLQLETEWQRMQDKFVWKKEISKEIEGAFRDEIRTLQEQINKYSLQLHQAADEEKRVKKQLEKQLQDAHKNLLIVESECEAIKQSIAKKENDISYNNTKISKLKDEITELQGTNKLLLVKLNDKSENFFNELQLQWANENKEKLEQKKELTSQCMDYQKRIEELRIEEKRLAGIVSNWDEQIKSYFNNLDKKIIEHSVESVLFQQVKTDQLAIKQNSSVPNIMNANMLYIRDGGKIALDDSEDCFEYDDYLEIAETNLSEIGLKRDCENMISCFVAAMKAGLAPLLCGFGSQQAALALSAAGFSEIPKIISIPSGYANVSELFTEINSSETDTVIIADVFGKMNEALILPILRENPNKKLIFIAEDVEDLKFLPKYYWHYIQLITVNDKARAHRGTFKYAHAEKCFNSNHTNHEESKKMSKILRSTGMENSYILARIDVYNNLLQDDMHYSEDKALEILHVNELQSLMNEEQKVSFENCKHLFEHSSIMRNM